MSCALREGGWNRLSAPLLLLLPLVVQGFPDEASGMVAVDSKLAAVWPDAIVPFWTAPGGLIPTEPASIEGGFVVGAGSTLYRLSASTGRVVWRASMPGRIFSPTVSGNRVFVGTEAGTVAALDLHGGRRIWAVALEGWIYSPAVVGNAVLVTGRSPLVRALHIDSGELLWEQSLPNEAVYRPIHTPVAGVVVTTFSGHVLALDPPTGRTKWAHREAIAQHSPVVSGGLLVFRGFDGRVTARSAEDGHVLWRAESGITGVQLESDGRYVVLFHGTHDIRLLHALSGSQLGVFSAGDEHVERAWIVNDHVQALSRGGTATLPRRIKVHRWAINSSQERLR